jgi:hypothetical protein
MSLLKELLWDNPESQIKLYKDVLSMDPFLVNDSNDNKMYDYSNNFTKRNILY